MNDNLNLNNEFDERLKIINAARKLVMADGLITSAKDITMEAGVSDKTFYKYFKSEDEIFIELLNTRFGLVSDDLLSKPLDEKIKTFCTELMMQQEVGSVKFCKQWIMYQFDNAKNETFFNDVELFKRVLESSIAKGELKEYTPVEELSYFVINTIYGAMLNWGMSNKKFEPLYYINNFSKFIFNSMIPYMAQK